MAHIFTTTSSTNTVENNPPVTRLRSDSIERFLKQISINKFGLEFLSNNDTKTFLTAAFSTIDSYYTISNLQESLDTFFQYIVGQSVFALRHCSLVQQNSLPSQPCIAISTLFLRVQPEISSTFLVYRLVPLPIVYNNDMYVYSDLPKIIGIDPIDQQIIIWKEEIDIKQCIFSRLVLCKKMPISIPLTKSSCLSQLLDNAQSSTNMCQVTRSKNIEQDFMQIDDGLWFFFNIHHDEQCQIYSTSDHRTEVISINEPAIVSMPCNKPITCMNLKIPTTSCTPRRTLVTSHLPTYSHSQARIFLPIKDMTQTIISSYQSQYKKTINELMTALSSKNPSIKQIFQNIYTYMASTVIIILVALFLFIVKFTRKKLQKQIDYIESNVETILRL
ncbi:unnamed protein product [Rotaria sp. Silwood1]|nr:unnamed protein product [Rotaria sp. Silwood1]